MSIERTTLHEAMKGLNDRALLWSLASRGPSTGNQITDVENVSRISRRLQERGLLTRTVGTFPANPRPAYTLSLTVRGLIEALAMPPSLDPPLFVSLRHWRHLLPAILGNWALFRRERVEGIAIMRLCITGAMFVSEEKQLSQLRGRNLTGAAAAEIYQYDFYTPNIGDSLDPSEIPKELQRLYRACAKDPELREFVIRCLNDKLSNLIDEQKFVRVLKKVL